MGSARSRDTRARRILRWGPVAAAGAVFVFGFVSPGGSRSAESPAAAQTPGGTEARDVYLRDCAECHGGTGTGTPHAPSLIGVGAGYVDYVLSTGRMPIEHPDDPIERGPDPYSPELRAALAQHVDSLTPPHLRGPGIPSVDVEGADVARGGELYRANCAACHHTNGVGGALINRAAPSVRDSTESEVAEAVRVGPFEMPAFGTSAMTDQEVEDVTAYVTEVLQETEDRGGLSIWHLGPVPEGAVAIIVGLGALLLAAVWIEGRVPRRVDEEPTGDAGDAPAGGGK